MCSGVRTTYSIQVSTDPSQKSTKSSGRTAVLTQPSRATQRSVSATCKSHARQVTTPYFFVMFDLLPDSHNVRIATALLLHCYRSIVTALSWMMMSHHLCACHPRAELASFDAEARMLRCRRELPHSLTRNRNSLRRISVTRLCMATVAQLTMHSSIRYTLFIANHNYGRIKHEP